MTSFKDVGHLTYILYSFIIDRCCISLYGGIEFVTLLFAQDLYPCLSVKFVTDGHTVGRKWLTGCGELTNWIFFMGVSILITPGWVFVPMITTCYDEIYSYVYGQTLWDGT